MTSISFGHTNSGSQVGINHGSIHLPPERPETPPPPFSTVPFRRDPDFVDCGILLDQIQEKGSTQGARIALIGLGGVGKSQLAIEYCHRVLDRSPDTWVFWIHASNATRFEQSCREIADRAKIRGRQDPKANIFKLLHDWLNNAKTGQWVLVLDNLDDDKFLHAIPSTQSRLVNDDSGVPERSIWSYFCQNSNGCIVMTSRSRQVALRTVEEYDILPVKPMNEPHAISLFEKKVDTQYDRSAMIQLVAALEFMPLAIVQAAAFIKQRAPRETVTKYLERFQKSDRQKIKLLDYEGGQLRRDPEAKSAILLTWQISFEHIQERRPSAAGLLSLMSFFDRQGIPGSLLLEGKATKETDKESNISDTDDDESVSSEIDNFENDILLLRDYSLISVTSDQVNFEMHRLVQVGMQEWLQAQGILEHWQEIFIRRLERNFPDGEFENWKECQLLFPHVQCTLMRQHVGKASMEEWASLLHKAATFALTRGNFVDGRRMAKRAMRARRDLFGLKNEKAISSSNILGLAYSSGGKWKEAEELQLQAMGTCKQVLGPEHPSTLASIANLASTYWNQGRWKEAEELQAEELKLCSKALGPEHPSTLTSIANLASTYWNQGRWKEAEELQVQVLETYKQVLGPEHPSTLTSIANLASTYWNQGRWKEAEELQAEELKLCSKALGPEHPSTLASIANLASTYRNQGRWKEAEELQVQVLETYKQVLGPEHPSTLTSIANLASTYWNQGRWKEAEELEVQALETYKRVLGPEHPSTLTSMNNLAFTLRCLGEDEAALQMMAKCAECRGQRLGPNHPSTLSSISTWKEWHSTGKTSPFKSAQS
ncbi:P-loop containing nucleoside triphosphate hydrolase protein [Penicillium atrosanguineum]|nr:P-loop containing nucleoside triphosphate hydrolase protein [Penicillium atrosanguineum]KAJ5148047.1 P-loop containing nucleoside triphosphate hydrolase protein [Penicillium atrosanguineum]